MADAGWRQLDRASLLLLLLVQHVLLLQLRGITLMLTRTIEL
jgi:hypothetical protein